jgi:cytochrome c-type biogenesis protein CcmH/NrfF
MRRSLILIGVLVAVIVTALPTLAQSNAGDDVVDTVMSSLFVWEKESRLVDCSTQADLCATEDVTPLRDCTTLICESWRNIIGMELATGQSVSDVLAYVVESQNFVHGSPVPETHVAAVSDDTVNAIAKKLYCPVCENIPLDTCGTAACQDWRYEIRLQVASFQTEQAIVNDFITRFGERVVGTPQDPLLRAMSLVVPWVVVIGAAIAVLYSLLRLRQPDEEPVVAQERHSDDNFRQLLEQDISG